MSVTGSFGVLQLRITATESCEKELALMRVSLFKEGVHRVSDIMLHLSPLSISSQHLRHECAYKFLVRNLPLNGFKHTQA